MNDSICLTLTAPESGVVLTAVTPPLDFFDEALDVLISVDGEVRADTLNVPNPILPELGELALLLPLPLELCTAYARHPWNYPALTLQAMKEP